MINKRTEIEIAAPIDTCFTFARDITIHTETVWKHTKERAIGGVTSGLIGPDQTVTFQATHFFVRQKLTSRITEYKEPFLFVDEMQKGAFKTLRHVHSFEAIGDRTRMVDILVFEAPFGLIGRLVERLILKKYMQRFLEYRNQQLKKRIELLYMNVVEQR